ncbi:glycosyltransferase [Pseudomonas sp. GD04087]|uniref:glycosyltransferase family 2 protein n=1 Tax=unclassified Pseudomonas TaxID=196821 RepID=UPI00244B9424|nr:MULTISPECIES: glycosyltransferase [unclassified Pseudomonas]MDH0287772.1 glycosyltransferase [Pseudomonas sp. GD04087]MDH1050803.1 glycosyltransferase [Pseudomonas sp. GD03903]MDH2002785.1 glycosyltransferase [Pseudomonas sp. GD03691]
MSVFDLSLVMNFHAEGVLAQWSLWGAQRMREHSCRFGVRVQLIAVLDCADAETTRMVRAHPALLSGDRVLDVHFADLGLSRNAGAESAQGSYVGFLDGDDYCSANWLTSAMQVAQSWGDQVVVHPEYIVSHGAVRVLARAVDQLTDNYDTANCFKAHPWGSAVFARRSVFLEIPYQTTRVRETGFGYEDWHWGLEIIASGRNHTIATETAFFYRRKRDSMLVDMNARQAVLRPGRFFATCPYSSRK